LKSDSGYPKDTGVNKPWQPLRIAEGFWTRESGWGFVLVLTLFIFKVPNYMLARTLTERVV